MKCSSSRQRREERSVAYRTRFKIAISIGGAIIFVSLLGEGGVANAAACGALNQRPCRVNERIPSCNRGLVEDFRHGRCVVKAKPALPRLGKPIIRPRPPLQCGALNQRPCRVNERIPSCNRGLVEDFRHGRCVVKAKPALPRLGKPIIRPRPPLQCGALNQRACKVTERIPSCDRGLVERRGRCIRLTNCGAEGQRPCKITERIPSCDRGLVEYVNGKCMRPVCGGLNMRACQIGERIPSCNKGLRESLGKCIRLKPGEIPVLATIGEYSSTLAEMGQSECIKLLDKLRAPSTTVMGVHLSAAAGKYFAIGFACASLGELDQISGYTDLAQEMNRQFHKLPCVKWATPVRPVCTIFQSTIVTGGAAARCAVELAKQKLIEGPGGRSSVRDTWLGIGKFAWTARKLLKKKNGKEDKKKKGADKSKDGKNAEVGKNGSKDSSERNAMDYVLKGFGLQIKYTAAAQKVLNGPLCRGIQ